MNDFTDFKKIIEELIALFDHLIPIEQEKLDAAIKNRVTFVEDCMHKEQAAVLQLRGLEQKREAEQIHSGRFWSRRRKKRLLFWILYSNS